MLGFPQASPTLTGQNSSGQVVLARIAIKLRDVYGGIYERIVPGMIERKFKSTELMPISTNETGSSKCNMSDAKPEVRISWFVDKIEIRGRDFTGANVVTGLHQLFQN